jgi:hypothetical protein
MGAYDLTILPMCWSVMIMNSAAVELHMNNWELFCCEDAIMTIYEV